MEGKMEEKINISGGIRLTWREWKRIQLLKELDIQVCEFCQRINLLNLGWKPWKQIGCQSHGRKHVLCWQLCLKAARSIVGCELYELGREIKQEAPVKPNQTYDKCACYSCGKELKGASKKGVIKHRNDPKFWGIESEFKILCLECIGKKFWLRMKAGKRKTYHKYLRRGYE